MINKTKGAWILARNTGETKYNLAKNQISAMQSEIHDEGYVHTGTSTLHFPLQSELGGAELNRVLTAASAGRISAVFVFSIRKLLRTLKKLFDWWTGSMNLASLSMTTRAISIPTTGTVSRSAKDSKEVISDDSGLQPW